jgi:Na+-transporting methylmalonyl-CoA/oxaloacetate decarboxylase gamma subunit
MNTMNPSTNTAGQVTPKRGGFGRLAIVLLLLLIAVCGIGYLYLRMTFAEFERDKAVVEKRLSDAHASANAVDARYNAAIAACTMQEQTCRAELDKCKRSMQTMVETPPAPTSAPNAM